jgi:predicted transcriptional regulator
VLNDLRASTVLILAMLTISILATTALILLAFGLPLNVGPGGLVGTSIIRPSTAQIFVQGFFDDSFAIAPASWAVLAGAWIWRGKLRSKWNSSGFDQDSFDLLVKMKGGPTRVKLLNALAAPKDRSKLAQEMGMDWKAVDRHVQLLLRYSFVKEEQAFGAVKLYTLTPEGEKLLHLIQEMAAADQGAPKVSPNL